MIEQIAAKNLLNRVKYNEWFGADYNEPLPGLLPWVHLL